jgi:hypothetical protein
MKIERHRIEVDGDKLKRFGEGEHPGTMKALGLPSECKTRKRLYNSSLQISRRDWTKLQAMPEAKPKDFETLHALHLRTQDACVMNNRPLVHLDKVRASHTGPIMIFECGFGFSTFKTLEWCAKNDGYLVTVDMPIATAKVRKSSDYKYLYWFGVDRYWSKYKFCKELRDHPIAQKRWLWVNDDIYKVFEKVVESETFRKKLFLNDTINYLFKDAIHDHKFDAQMYKELGPFMPKGSVFYSYGTGYVLD